VHTGLQQADGLGGMQPVGGTDAGNVHDRAVLQQFPDSVEVGNLLPHPVGADQLFGWQYINQGNDFRRLMGRDKGRVAAANVAQTDDGKTSATNTKGWNSLTQAQVLARRIEF